MSFSGGQSEAYTSWRPVVLRASCRGFGRPVVHRRAILIFSHLFCHIVAMS